MSLKFPRWMLWTVLIVIGIGLFYAGWYFGHSDGTESKGDVLTGSVNIASEPAGANVYVDGEYTGETTPCFISGLSTGPHTLRLTLEHYQQHVDEITVYAEQITYIEWTLNRAIEKTRLIQPGPGLGKDSYVSEYNPVSNYGSDDSLFVSASRVDEHYRAYLQFDMSTIPNTAVITDAKLGLYYVKTSSKVDTQIGVYMVVDSWDEDDLSWINQPHYSAKPESTTHVSAAVTSNFIYWDIRDLVQGWVDGSISNRGLLLMDTDESSVTAWKQFYSSSQAWPQPLGISPKLEVIYYNPNP